MDQRPVPVFAWSKAWVCGSSIAGTLGSNPAEGMDVSFVMSVVCCQVEVYAWGSSLVQRSLTKCSVSECDRETSMREP
jgi:hypothetical protein